MAPALAPQVRKLISNKKLRKKMGEAAREETLKWNWQAATSVLRNLQYTRAVRNFDDRERAWKDSLLRPYNWLKVCFGFDEPEPETA